MRFHTQQAWKLDKLHLFSTMHSAGSIPMMSLSCCLQLTSGTRRHTVDWQRGNGRWRRKPLRRSRLCRRSTRLKRRRWTLRGLLTVRIRRQRGSRLRPEQLDSWNNTITPQCYSNQRLTNRPIADWLDTYTKLDPQGFWIPIPCRLAQLPHRFTAKFLTLFSELFTVTKPLGRPIRDEIS